MNSRRALFLVFSVAAAMVGTSVAAASATTITLRASTTLDGIKVAKRKALSLLDTRKLRILRRPSAASVTVGYPRTKVVRRHGKPVRVKATPCARATFKLRIVQTTADPLAFVRNALPNAFQEGAVQSFTTRNGSKESTLSRAWRLSSTIKDGSYLFVSGRSSEPFASSGKALTVLSLEGRTVSIGGPCGGTNTFFLGPGVEPTIALGG